MTTSECGNQFRRYLIAKNMSDSTIKTYTSLVLKFLKHHKLNPSKITSKMIYTYCIGIKSPRTRNQTIGCLKTFFTHGCGMPKVVNVPYSKVPRSLPDIVSKHRFESVMNNCDNVKHRLILRMMFSHGLRRGEVLNIKLKWISSQLIEGKKQFYLKVTGKGAKDRFVWLSFETMSDMVKYLGEYDIDPHSRDEHLFQSSGGGQYSATSVYKICKRWFGVNPHTLRHSCASELINRQTNDLSVRDMLGHSSLMVTSTYHHMNLSSKVGISA